MADFVKLSIFGTVSFYKTPRPGPTDVSEVLNQKADDKKTLIFFWYQVFEVTTRYVDLQPVGMGEFWF